MSSSLPRSKIPLPVKSRIPIPVSSVKLTKNLPASSESLKPLNKNIPDIRQKSYETSKFLHNKKIAKGGNNLKNAETVKKNFHEKFAVKPSLRNGQQHDQQNSKIKVKIKDENVPSPVLKTKSVFSRNKQLIVKKSAEPTSNCKQSMNTKMKIKDENLPPQVLITKSASSRNKQITTKNTIDPTSDCKQSLKIKMKIKDENLPPPVSTTETSFSGNEQISIENNIQLKSEWEVNETIKKPKHLALQEDLHFEPNEFYRNLILKERHLSPSILNMNPGTKLSSVMVERPSVYKKMSIVKNPIEEAMKEIENLKLENKRISQLKQNEAIPVSPKDRYSIYKRFPLSDDPFQEALKSLEVLKAKSKVKSAKKVRFCLAHDESPAVKNEKDLPETLISESRLTNISEKSEENTPEIVPTEAPTEKHSISDEKPICSAPNKVTCTSQLSHQNTFTPSVKLESAVHENASSNFLSSMLSSCNNKAIRYPSLSTPFVKSSTKDNVLSMCSNSAVHAINSTHVRHSIRDADRLISNSLKCVRNERKGLLNSPRPLLLNTRLNHAHDISPEILNKCDPQLLLEAPICTPLVLKGLANDSVLELSPVRQKLEFLEEGDKVAQDDTSPIFRLPSINVEHICTQKKVLDQLADKECSYFLSSAAFPIISGRYLCNPIAHILTEGDEMHFVPVKEEISL